MAHYALLDRDNKVIRVIVGMDENSEDGKDWELVYQIQFEYKCKRTSYNTIGGEHLLDGTPFRKNYAGVGYIYDEQRDAFIPEKPYQSWVLNEDTCTWGSPIPMPTDGKFYNWNEETTSWVELKDVNNSVV
jgi:hypothetical protein